MKPAWDITRVRSARQAAVFQRLYELYCHELAPVTGMRPDSHGCYAEPDVADSVRGEKHVELWLARDDRGPAGFLWLEKAGNGWAVDQLYVLPTLRRKGLAAELARHGLSRHEGAWEVFVLDGNTEGLAFWRKFLPSAPAWVESRETREGRPGTVWRTP